VQTYKSICDYILNPKEASIFTEVLHSQEGEAGSFERYIQAGVQRDACVY